MPSSDDSTDAQIESAASDVLYKVQQDDGGASDAVSAGGALVSLRPIEDMIASAVDDTREVMRVASDLATVLNHDRVRVTHLLIALTLTPRGVERLHAHGINKANIRLSCWNQTKPGDPTTETRRFLPYSDNVEEIIRIAQREADVRSLRITVDEIVQVLNREPLRSHYEYLWNGAGVKDPIKDLSDRVDAVQQALAYDMAERFNRLEAAMGSARDVQEKTFNRSKYIKHMLNLIAGVMVAAGIAFAIAAFYPR